MKELKEMTLLQLRNRKESLERTIKICEEYLESAHNTFLGPLGARAEIRKCSKELDKIHTIMIEKITEDNE